MDHQQIQKPNLGKTEDQIKIVRNNQRLLKKAPEDQIFLSKNNFDIRQISKEKYENLNQKFSNSDEIKKDVENLKTSISTLQSHFDAQQNTLEEQINKIIEKNREKEQNGNKNLQDVDKEMKKSQNKFKLLEQQIFQQSQSIFKLQQQVIQLPPKSKQVNEFTPGGQENSMFVLLCKQKSEIEFLNKKVDSLETQTNPLIKDIENLNQKLENHQKQILSQQKWMDDLQKIDNDLNQQVIHTIEKQKIYEKEIDTIQSMQEKQKNQFQNNQKQHEIDIKSLQQNFDLFQDHIHEQINNMFNQQDNNEIKENIQSQQVEIEKQNTNIHKIQEQQTQFFQKINQQKAEDNMEIMESIQSLAEKCLNLGEQIDKIQQEGIPSQKQETQSPLNQETDKKSDEIDQKLEEIQGEFLLRYEEYDQKLEEIQQQLQQKMDKKEEDDEEEEPKDLRELVQKVFDGQRNYKEELIAQTIDIESLKQRIDKIKPGEDQENLGNFEHLKALIEDNSENINQINITLQEFEDLKEQINELTQRLDEQPKESNNLQEDLKEQINELTQRLDEQPKQSNNLQEFEDLKAKISEITQRLDEYPKQSNFELQQVNNEKNDVKNDELQNLREAIEKLQHQIIQQGQPQLQSPVKPDLNDFQQQIQELIEQGIEDKISDISKYISDFSAQNQEIASTMEQNSQHIEDAINKVQENFQQQIDQLVLDFQNQQEFNLKIKENNEFLADFKESFDMQNQQIQIQLQQITADSKQNCTDQGNQLKSHLLENQQKSFQELQDKFFSDLNNKMDQLQEIIETRSKQSYQELYDTLMQESQLLIQQNCQQLEKNQEDLSTQISDYALSVDQQLSILQNRIIDEPIKKSPQVEGVVDASLSSRIDVLQLENDQIKEIVHQFSQQMETQLQELDKQQTMDELIDVTNQIQDYMQNYDQKQQQIEESIQQIVQSLENLNNFTQQSFADLKQGDSDPKNNFQLLKDTVSELEKQIIEQNNFYDSRTSQLQDNLTDQINLTTFIGQKIQKLESVVYQQDSSNLFTSQYDEKQFQISQELQKKDMMQSYLSDNVDKNTKKLNTNITAGSGSSRVPRDIKLEDFEAYDSENLERKKMALKEPKYQGNESEGSSQERDDNADYAKIYQQNYSGDEEVQGYEDEKYK